MGPGTGIAPFRSFWHHRRQQALDGQTMGSCWLFFGCRNKQMDLYSEEKSLMHKEGVLSRVFLALSREEGVPKVIILTVSLYCEDAVVKRFCFLPDLCARISRTGG